MGDRAERAVSATAHQVLLFYRYVTITEPEEVARRLRLSAEKYQLTGRAIIATEGINATFEGTTENSEAFLREFLTDERFASMQIKRSIGTGASFQKLVVKVREEIVGTGFTKEEAHPEVRTAPRLNPDELRAWYEAERDFTVVDMRNSYEFASGHFENAVQPNISASRHLPLGMKKLESLKNKTIVTVCTGGVRCEKMSAYLMSHGFTDVYQLDGGIHSYMERYPGMDFKGTLYTFDQRQTMDFGGAREVIGECHICSSTTERYADCANDTCHLHFLACDGCRNPEDRAYCSDVCKI